MRLSKYFKGMLFVALATAVALMGISFETAPVQAQGNVIIVGSKDFDENIVLARIMQFLLEDAGYIVVDNINTGNTNTVRGELLAGNIDIYPEYTATGVLFLAEQFPSLVSTGDAYDPTSAIAIVNSFDNAYNDVSWLVPAPGNSSYALAVTREFSEANGLLTIQDLADYANAGNEVIVAGSPDFFTRPDAFLTYTETYQFSVPDTNRFIASEAENPTLTLNALRNGEAGVNVAMAYSTSGELLGNEFVTLEDVDNAQPYFQPAPVIRGEILRQNPDIIPLLRPAFALIETQTMQRFVAATTLGDQATEDVARDFLIQNGFISEVDREDCFLTRPEGDETAANLRSGPGTSFPPRGILNPGARVEALGQADGSDGFVWYRLRTGEWVRSDVVTAEGGCADLPVVTASD